MSQSTPIIIVTPSQGGGATIQPIEDALLAAQSSNAGPTEPTYKVLGTQWLDTSGGSPGTYILKIYNGTSWITLQSGI